MDQSKIVTVFQFKQESSVDIRTVTQNGDPWFVATDVCKILGLVNSRQAVESLDEDERGVCNVYTPGGQQTMNCVNESGLYHLIFTSRKDEAKTFRRWVTQEVLPSIRKTGQYSISKTPRQIRSDSSAERCLLPTAEKDQYIFHVVDLLGIANGRDVHRYTRWYSGGEARRRMAELAEQGDLIVADKTRRTTRYSRPVKKSA